MLLICEWCKCKVDWDDAVRWRGHWFCCIDCKCEALEHYDADERDGPP